MNVRKKAGSGGRHLDLVLLAQVEACMLKPPSCHAEVWKAAAIPPPAADDAEPNASLPRVLPALEPLQDPAYFARVVVDPICRTVVWPNGADLAPEALYELPNEEAERKAS